MGNQNGSWKRLKPLHTEGQGLPGGANGYSGFTAVIPYGIGIRKNLGGGNGRRYSSWSISLELTMRKTFSDYIDDVSTSYYDSAGNGTLGAGYSGDALLFSDPSGVYNKGLFGEPQQRGDPTDNDAYMLGILSLNYKIHKRRRNLPKF